MFARRSVNNFILVLAATFLVVSTLPEAEFDLPCTSEVCPEPQSAPAQQVLLQTSHKKVGHSPQVLEEAAKTGINPSGAAAPLSEDGYQAVADRCCQAEMRQFIERQVTNLNLEVCEEAGLYGIIPYHSCEKGPATFDTLTANLLYDSTLRCTWISPAGQCQPIPEDCESFGGIPPDRDCSCSRSKAATVTLDMDHVTVNNVGGLGPNPVDGSGAQEFVLTNAGLSNTGEAFDVVIYSVGPAGFYTLFPQYHGAYAGFGGLTIAPPGTYTYTQNGVSQSIDFPGEITLQFDFFKTGTRTPLTLQEVHLSTFDLDGTTTGGQEYSSSSGYKGYVTEITPNIVVSRVGGGRTQFESQGTINNIPNPSSPESLDADQRGCSVMFFYEDVSTLQLTFGMVDGTAGMGRFLFFSFTSSLKDRCGD